MLTAVAYRSSRCHRINHYRPMVGLRLFRSANKRTAGRGKAVSVTSRTTLQDRRLPLRLEQAFCLQAYEQRVKCPGPETGESYDIVAIAPFPRSFGQKLQQHPGLGGKRSVASHS